MTEEEITLPDKEIVGLKTIDIRSSLRKLENRNIMLIAKTIYTKGKLTPKELRKITGLDEKSFNHAIVEMKKEDLVIKDEGMYYLTQYSAILLGALNQLRLKLRDSKSKLFEPKRVCNEDQQDQSPEDLVSEAKTLLA